MEKKKTVDVLVEGKGGDLIFKPVKASKEELHRLIGESKNPVIKKNVFKPGSEKKLKV